MRNCDCCKFKELSPAEFPCCDCGANNHWEAEEETEGRFCTNCKYASKSGEDEPCSRCLNHVEWQAEEEKKVEIEKKCENCLYSGLNIHEEPCKSCCSSSDVNNWLPKKDLETEREEVEAPATPEPECVDCKFEDTAALYFPCSVCDRCDKWQEKKLSQRQGDCEYCKYNCCNPIDNWEDIDEPELEPESVDIPKMNVINLEDDFSVLYGYGGMKILQRGTVLTDICNPAIRAVLYKLIKKVEGKDED